MIELMNTMTVYEFLKRIDEEIEKAEGNRAHYLSITAAYIYLMTDKWSKEDE